MEDEEKGEGGGGTDGGDDKKMIDGKSVAGGVDEKMPGMGPILNNGRKSRAESGVSGGLVKSSSGRSGSLVGGSGQSRSDKERAKFFLLNIYGAWFSTTLAILDFKEMMFEEIEMIVRDILDILFKMND